MQTLTHWIDGEADPQPTGAGSMSSSRHWPAFRASRRCDQRTSKPRSPPPNAPAAWAALHTSERAAWLDRLAARGSALDAIARAESRDAGKPSRSRAVSKFRAPSRICVSSPGGDAVASESHHGEAGLNYTLRTAARRGREDLAVEPAAVPVHLEDRAGAGGRQRGGRETFRSDSAHRRDAGRTRGGDRFPARRTQYRPGPRSRSRRAARRRIPGSRRFLSPAAPRSAAHRRAAAPKFKKLSLELGGKNPDPGLRRQRLARTWTRSCARLPESGQICLCGSRLLVERADLRRIPRCLRRSVLRSLRVGDPMVRGPNWARWFRRRISTRSSPPSPAPAKKAAMCSAAATRWTGPAGSWRRR